MKQIEKDGVKWELIPGFANSLDSVLAASSSGKVIKETPSKLVQVCDLNGVTYYTKHYRHDAVAFRSLKFLVKPSQARQEWELSQQLKEREIPIVSHLAFGERWERGVLKESILITEGFDGVPVRKAGPEFAPQVLALIQKMHSTGVMQHDLHGQNVLINMDTGEARLVDLHGCVVKERLSAEEKEENLAVLRKFMPVTVPDHIEERGAEIRRQHKSRRARRSLRHNRDFAIEDEGGLRWIIRRRLLTEAAETVLSDPDGFLANKAKLRKQGRSSTVGMAEGLVLKRYNLKKRLNLFKDMIRSSRARRAFKKSYHLELVEIPTAKAIAAGHRSVLGFPTVSYLLMQEIPGAVELKQFSGITLDLVRRVAELVARMHEEGFSHRDLKMANLLLDVEGKLYLIDLEGLEFVGEVGLARARADLARFFKSAADHADWKEVYEREFQSRYGEVRKVVL